MRRSDDGVDEGEGVVANRGIAIGGAGEQVHRHARRRAHIGNPAQDLPGRIDQTCHDVVAASALEFAQSRRRAENAAPSGKARRDKAVGKIAADDAFDRCQQVSTDAEA